MTTLKALSLGISLLGMTLMGIGSLQAQEQTSIPTEPGVQDVFNRAANHHTGTFYDITGVSGQFNTIFGWRFLSSMPLFKGSYIDNLITADGRLIGVIYEDYLQQQTSGPLIRTLDLPNPYNSSLAEQDSAISP